jgi:acyl-CoA reductase-like NAD-dependent aldehyde dehydrogenase
MNLSNPVLSIAERAHDDYALSHPAHIAQVMQKARGAAKIWAAINVTERSQLLAQFSRLLLSEVDVVCQTISRTTGKVQSEALLGEVYPVLDLARYYEKYAARILKTQGVPTSPFTFPFATAEISRRPYGVVAVISPWNYPFQITVSQLLSALFAGNAVIFKPSELSVPIGRLIMDLFAKLDLPTGLVQCINGDGHVGELLINAGPDLVVFTGSLANGRAVMQRATQHPIPVLLELGGKDAMIVFADANLERACDGALYGAFANSGQVCVSVERLYVEESCYPRFLHSLCEGVAKLKTGYGSEGDLGAMTSKRQIEIVKKQYQDALAKGALASGPLINEGDTLNPVVLWNVTPDMLVMQQETFGPLMAVIPFSGENEAVRLANAGEFSLNASIWSRDIDKAKRIAMQLEVGNWSINDVLKNVGHPGLPFGGINKSGFGRCHGAEGLRNFTYTVSGLTNRSPLDKEPNWFPYSETRYQQLKGFLDIVFGTGTLVSRVRRNWHTIKAFRSYARINLQQRWRNLLLMLPWNREF